MDIDGSTGDLDDAAAIARVHVASWRTTYRGLLPDDFLSSLSEESYTDRWRRVMGDGLSRVFVVDQDEGVVGFASCGRERAGETGFSGELYAIYILDRAQRQGPRSRAGARRGGRASEMKLPDMIVWVLRDNAAARNFYERLGGVYVREQPITIGAATLEEVSYGWRSLDEIALLRRRERRLVEIEAVFHSVRRRGAGVERRQAEVDLAETDAGSRGSAGPSRRIPCARTG